MLTTLATTALYNIISKLQMIKRDPANAPLYLRTAVWYFASINFFGDAAHWLMQPSGGLEKIARLPISPKPSLEKGCMQFLQGQEGLGQVSQSIALFFIVIKRPRLTLPFSVWAAAHQIVQLLTTSYYKKIPSLNYGTASIKNGPGRFRKYGQSMPIIVAAVYACLTEN
jgi:hypothetical protein